MSDKVAEDKFIVDWDVTITDYLARKNLIIHLCENLTRNYDDLHLLKELFGKVLNNLDLIPKDLLPREKIAIVHHYVKTFAACIMCNIDDIIFSQNGRVLTAVRKQEVPPAHIHTQRFNWHHNDFGSDDAGMKIPLSVNCADSVVKMQKIMKRRFTKELNDLEVSLLHRFARLFPHNFVFFYRLNGDSICLQRI